MKNLILILFVCPLVGLSQIRNHNRVFNDSIVYKDFNQGFIDAELFYDGTTDYLVGFVSLPTYYIPAVISFMCDPKDYRLTKQINPNNEYLYSNKDYYNGFKYGAKKKKKRRLVQGATSSLGALSLLLIYALSTFN